MIEKNIDEEQNAIEEPEIVKPEIEEPIKPVE
jgi:hypothetical protein